MVEAGTDHFLAVTLLSQEISLCPELVPLYAGSTINRRLVAHSGCRTGSRIVKALQNAL